MNSFARGVSQLAFATVLCSPILLLTPTSVLSDTDRHKRVDHVLLISIDGFHAVDLENCIATKLCRNLAKLTNTAVVYPNASSTKPSDSFPGLLAQITGGTSNTHGVFYDDSYDRTLFAPAGHPPQPCKVGPGTEMNIAEPVDTNLHSIDGGVPAALTGPNSAVAIDPENLPGRLVNGFCTPVWPHNLVRANTIFAVIHRHGLRTAWSDKHPAYDIINGNDPDNQPANGPGTNVDDFFAPEINSDLSAANVKLIGSLGLKSTAPAPATDPACPGPACGSDFTSSIDGIEWYDGIKVQAVINEINGFDHTGKHYFGTPAILGMNFQAVSVGQKLKIGGYTDPVATPSPNLSNTIAFVDRSIGQFVGALQSRGLFDKTLVIVSAKHGQSPIDRTKRTALNDGTVIAGPIGGNFAFDIADDGALIWLKDNSGTKTADAVAALNAYQQNVGDTGIVEWLSGPLLTLMFQNPATDSRTPDIIGIARTGVIYTGGSKIAEHGGFNEDDVHVALFVAHPSIDKTVINTAVVTAQIAPTILKVLGLDPSELEAVRMEGTRLLPGFE
jgi:predicted AlkP superfamily pyrophosphatase or phosphodiesterase